MNPAMSPAVQAAIGRRASGAPVPQLSQVSPQAPMASGTPPQPLPISAMDKTSSIPKSPTAPSQKYQPTDQASMIAMALTEQLKSLTKLESEKLKAQSGQSIQSPAPQVPAFNQPAPMNSTPTSGASMPVSSMQGGSPFGNSPF